MNDGFGREQQHAERRHRERAEVNVGRSTITPMSTMAIMMNARCVATSAPDSTR
jgi:hypothetical protein